MTRVAIPTLTQLVEASPSIEEEDLRILFDKRLDVTSQASSAPVYVSLLAYVLTGFVFLYHQFPILNLDYLYVGVVVLIVALLLLARRITAQNTVKDYLEARKIIRARAKPRSESQSGQ